MITPAQIRLLKRAINEAAEWRGVLVGAAPSHIIDEFDIKIRDMVLAVRQVQALRKNYIQLLEENRALKKELETQP